MFYSSQYQPRIGKTNLVLLTLRPILVVFDTASRCPVVPASEPAWHGVTVVSMATTNNINPFRLWLHKCDTFSILDSSQITLVNVIFFSLQSVTEYTITQALFLDTFGLHRPSYSFSTTGKHLVHAFFEMILRC